MGDAVYSMKGWNYKLYYLMKANGKINGMCLLTLFHPE